MPLTLTKETIISEVIEKYPAVAEVLSEAGLGCGGCSSSEGETIADGLMSHGLTGEDVDSFLEQINTQIAALEKAGTFNEQKEENEKPKQIIITDPAAEKAKELMKKQNLNGEHALRIKATPGGCAGFRYGMAFDKLANANGDVVLEKSGLKILLDQKSAERLGGTTIDFVEDLEGSRFVFNNPSAKATCGCGKSFR